MAVKLRLAADAQIIWNKDSKQFYTCKHNSKTLGKFISISQSTIS